MRTWKVLRWENRPERTWTLNLTCPACGTDADMEVAEIPGGLVIAAIGLALILDPPSFKPPENFMPDDIQCRNCRKIFLSNKETADVR